MMVTYENEKITSKITQEEIDWANDVMERAKTSWPDLADIDTARMILKQGITHTIDDIFERRDAR